MKLLHATGNNYKFNLMKERLSCFKEIELLNPKMLNINVDVIENGKTAEENAIIKAKAYYDVVKMPIIAEDAGLLIDKFSDTEQPRLYVRRVNGKDNLSDEEILNYYIEKLKKYGDSKAHYYTGVALIDENGNLYSDSVDEKEFLLTSKKCETKSLKGGILEPISIDLEVNKYFDERTPEEIDNHYKSLSDRYCELVKKYILKK